MRSSPLETPVQAPITPSSDSSFTGWDLLALASLAALAVLAVVLWPRLPDPLPTHWGFDQPTFGPIFLEGSGAALVC